jgi:hypothetical protein
VLEVFFCFFLFFFVFCWEFVKDLGGRSKMSDRIIHRSPTQLERSFERATVYQTSTPYSTSSTVFREELDVKQRLEKQNFEMKMRIYHLEESLKKFQDGEHRHDQAASTAKAEVHDLKIKMEEMQIELEQRELLMVKASGVINTLKQELDRCKEGLERQEELEQKVRGLKHSNDDIAHEFRGQLIAREKEVNELRQQLMLKEQEKAQIEDRLKQAESSIAHLQDRVSDGQMDRVRIEEKWLKSQESYATLEEEVTQARAHIDLYKIRLEEEQEEKERLKQQIKDVMLIKDAAEERHRVRVLEVTNQYETQLKTLRDRHDSDMEKLRAGQVQMMADIRENYQQELSKKQIMMEKTLAELRVADTNEVHRTKEDLQARIDEKNEEIRALRHVASTERARMEALIAELESSRSDSREKHSNLELLRAELQVKIDENQVLQGMRKELQEVHQKHVELNEKFRQENLEKAQMQVWLENLHKENDEMRRKCAETEAELTLTKQELAKLSYVSTELGSKTETADSLARDNERWKLVHHKLQADLVEANHKHFAVSKDYEYLKDEHQKLRASLDTLQTEHRQVSLSLEDLRVQDKEHMQSLQVEKEQRQRLEASLQEHRARWIPMVKKMENCRTQLDQYHKLLSALGQERHVLWEKITPMLRMLQQAMRGWDGTLGTMMEGDVSPGKASYSAALHINSGPSHDSLSAFQTSLFPSSSAASNGASYDQTPSSPGLQFSLFSNPPATASAVSTSPGFSSFFSTTHQPHSKKHQHHRKSSRHQKKRSSHRKSERDLFFDAILMGKEERMRDYSSDDHSSGSEEEFNVQAAESTLQLLHQRQSQQLETFRQEMAVYIERVQWKMQKMGKFRHLLTQQATEHVKSVEKVHLLAQEKCHTLQQKLTETQQQLLRMQQIVQRDQQQHAKEVVEVQQLRDVLLQQHTSQVQQYENRLENALADKDKANQMIEQQQRQITRYQDELRTTQEALATVKEELLHLETLEDTVSQVTTRLESLLSEKALLTKDFQYQCEETRRAQEQLSSLHEHASLVQEQKEQEELMRSQLEEKCNDLVEKVHRLEFDNDSLRRRQIDPQLALALMDSQQQLLQPTPTHPAASRGSIGGQSGGAVIDRDTLLALEDRLQYLQQQAQVSMQRFERISGAFSSTFHPTNNANYALVNSNQNNWVEECISLRLQVTTLLQEQVSLVQSVAHLISLVKYSHQRLFSSSASPLGAYQTTTGMASSWNPRSSSSFSVPSVPPASLTSTAYGNGSMRMDDLAPAQYTPMSGQQLMHNSSSTANLKAPSSLVLPSSPGEKEELIVFGQHNRGLFSRSIVPPAHQQPQPQPPSSVPKHSSSHALLTNKKKSAPEMNLPSDYATTSSYSNVVHTETGLEREDLQQKQQQQQFDHHQTLDSTNVEDVAMVAEVRRRVQQVSQQRLSASASRQRSPMSSPGLGSKHGSGHFHFPPASSAPSLASSSNLPGNGASQPLSPTITSQQAPTTSYERQQTKKRLQQVDKRVQMLAKKLDKFEIGSSAATNN